MIGHMFRMFFLLASAVTTAGLLYWMGPLFLIVCLTLVASVFLFSMKADPRNDRVRPPRPTSFKTSYYTEL